MLSPSMVTGENHPGPMDWRTRRSLVGVPAVGRVGVRSPTSPCMEPPNSEWDLSKVPGEYYLYSHVSGVSIEIQTDENTREYVLTVDAPNSEGEIRSDSLDHLLEIANRTMNVVSLLDNS